MSGGAVLGAFLVILVLLVLTQQGGLKTWLKAKGLNQPSSPS
jgi:hypothetical protein